MVSQAEFPGPCRLYPTTCTFVPAVRITTRPVVRAVTCWSRPARPGTNVVVPADRADDRCCVIDSAVRRVVPGGERRHGNTGVSRYVVVPWHVLECVAEVAVRRIVLRIDDRLSRVVRVGYRARIIHAGHEHCRRITAGDGLFAVNVEGRTVHAAPLVGVNAKIPETVVIADRNRHEGRCPFLTKLRRFGLNSWAASSRIMPKSDLLPAPR